MSIFGFRFAIVKFKQGMKPPNAGKIKERKQRRRRGRKQPAVSTAGLRLKNEKPRRGDRKFRHCAIPSPLRGLVCF
jgi:hypothetical protein